VFSFKYGSDCMQCSPVSPSETQIQYLAAAFLLWLSWAWGERNGNLLSVFTDLCCPLLVCVYLVLMRDLGSRCNAVLVALLWCSHMGQ